MQIDEFLTKGEDLVKRLQEIKNLHKEANELVKSLDTSKLDDEGFDTAYEIAHEIAYAGNFEFDSFEYGFWLPSTC